MQLRRAFARLGSIVAGSSPSTARAGATPPTAVTVMGGGGGGGGSAAVREWVRCGERGVSSASSSSSSSSSSRGIATAASRGHAAAAAAVVAGGATTTIGWARGAGGGGGGKGGWGAAMTMLGARRNFHLHHHQRNTTAAVVAGGGATAAAAGMASTTAWGLTFARGYAKDAVKTLKVRGGPPHTHTNAQHTPKHLQKGMGRRLFSFRVEAKASNSKQGGPFTFLPDFCFFCFFAEFSILPHPSGTHGTRRVTSNRTTHQAPPLESSSTSPHLVRFTSLHSPHVSTHNPINRCTSPRAPASADASRRSAPICGKVNPTSP